MSKLNTRDLKKFKKSKMGHSLQMLTCYDFQTAQILNETNLDLILVGDSLSNVILGHETTIEVTLNEMSIFSGAVKRGAKNKFVIADLPFGSYSSFYEGLKNSVELFQKSKVEALKLEGANEHNLVLIKRLTQIGIPVMGHIGLTPQSVHELGGYYMHGKDTESEAQLISEAKSLEEAGCFSIVLECVKPSVSKAITENLKIPTIGIGSGNDVDGQVLVINDLLKMGKEDPPNFCNPIANLYQFKKDILNKYIDESSGKKKDPTSISKNADILN